MLLNLCSSLMQTSVLTCAWKEPMKNLRWAIVVLLAVSVQPAYADSFNISFLPPGTSVTPNVGLVSFEGLSIFKLGGHSYDTTTSALFNSSITAGASFTLPMGRNSPFTFTVTIPATLTPPVGGMLPDGSGFTLNVPPGKLVLTFLFTPGADVFPGGYYVSSGGQFIAATPEPEPGTIFLLATGLATIVGRKRTLRRLIAK